MEVRRIETGLPNSAFAAYGTYKKDVKSKKNTPQCLLTKTANIPDKDKEIAKVQLPFMTKKQKDITNGDQIQIELSKSTTTIADLKKRFYMEESELLKRLKETIKKLRESKKVEKKIIMEESELIKNIKKIIERMRSSDIDERIITEDSILIKKTKETMKAINSSKRSVFGAKEIISKFSTTNQFDLQAIESVEKNIKNKNMNLEIGAFSLGRIMEKAREELLGNAEESGAAAELQGLPDKQKESEEKTAMQRVTLKKMDMDRYDKPHVTDPKANLSLNVKA